MDRLILGSKGCVWRPSRFQQDSVQKDSWDVLMMSARDHLRRAWALSVFVISAWREGEGRLWGHKISFPTYEVLGSGLGEGTQKGPSLQRVSAASSHGSVESKPLARCSGTSRCKVWEVGGVRGPGNANGEDQERRRPGKAMGVRDGQFQQGRVRAPRDSF